MDEDMETTEVETGTLIATLRNVLDNLANASETPSKQAFYPQAYVTGSIWRRNFNRHTILRETNAGVVMTPSNCEPWNVKIQEPRNLEWLSMKHVDGADEVLTLLRLCQSTTGYTCMFPLVRIGWKNEHTPVMYVIATNKYAVVVDPTTAGVPEAVGMYLRARNCMKAFWNATHDLQSVYKFFASPAHEVFCLKTASREFLDRLNLKNEAKAFDWNPLPQLWALTGIQVPMVLVRNMERKVKENQVLDFCSATIAHVNYFMTYYQHKDNRTVHPKFGVKWSRSEALKPLLLHLPRELNLGPSFWKYLSEIEPGTPDAKYYVAAVMYCLHPMLRVTGEQEYQHVGYIDKVFESIKHYAEKRSDPFSVVPTVGWHNQVIVELAQWMSCTTNTERDMEKFQFIRDLMKHMLYNAPLFCEYIECQNTLQAPIN